MVESVQQKNVVEQLWFTINRKFSSNPHNPFTLSRFTCFSSISQHTKLKEHNTILHITFYCLQLPMLLNKLQIRRWNETMRTYTVIMNLKQIWSNYSVALSQTQTCVTRFSFSQFTVIKILFRFLWIFDEAFGFGDDESTIVIWRGFGLKNLHWRNPLELRRFQFS